MNVLSEFNDKHPWCVLAVWIGIVPVSTVLFIGIPTYLDRPIPDVLWLFALCILAFFSLNSALTYAAKPAVARLAAELCEAGSWKASGSQFSGRIGACSVVNDWSQLQRGHPPFNSLMLECPVRIGFLIERTAADDDVESVLRRTLAVTQFDLFQKLPCERGDKHALQTDDFDALMTLMRDGRFGGALAALEKTPAFRCLASLRVPGKGTLFLKGWILSPLAEREGLVLIRMVDSPRGAAAIRQDLALLCEIRDAIAQERQLAAAQ